MDEKKAYAKVAASLRDFGYADTTPAMIEEVHLAMKRGRPLPHGIIGRFARDQLEVLNKVERERAR